MWLQFLYPFHLLATIVPFENSLQEKVGMKKSCYFLGNITNTTQANKSIIEVLFLTCFWCITINMFSDIFCLSIANLRDALYISIDTDLRCLCFILHNKISHQWLFYSTVNLLRLKSILPSPKEGRHQFYSNNYVKLSNKVYHLS